MLGITLCFTGSVADECFIANWDVHEASETADAIKERVERSGHRVCSASDSLSGEAWRLECGREVETAPLSECSAGNQIKYINGRACMIDGCGRLVDWNGC